LEYKLLFHGISELTRLEKKLEYKHRIPNKTEIADTLLLNNTGKNHTPWQGEL